MNLLPFDVIKDNLLIPIILLIPLLSSILAFILKKQKFIREIIILLLSFLFIIVVYLAITKIDSNITFYTLMNFSETLTISFTVEPLGSIFLLIIGILWFFANLYSVGYLAATNDQDQSRFFGFFSLSILYAVGIALSANLMTIFCCYELLTLATYPLVIHSGSEKAFQSGRQYMAYLFASSTFLLMPAVIILHNYNNGLIFNQSLFFISLPSKATLLIIILCLIYGTAKTAIFPLHGWLPKAMVAPTPVSALLHAVAVVKAGIFTLVKIFVYVFGIETIGDFINKIAFNANWFTYIATISIIYASIKAMKQESFKAILAYSTIAQLSMCLLALAISSQTAVTACILHVFSHAFCKISLFFATGIVYILYNKINISECKLIYKKNKILSIFMSINCLSLIGIPPFLGFWSKYYIIISAWESKNWPTVITIVISTIFTTIYLIPIFYNFFWEEKESDFNHKKISFKNTFYLYIPLAFTTLMCIVGMIFIPQIIEFIEKNVNW